jgi:hypothetical protein
MKKRTAFVANGLRRFLSSPEFYRKRAAAEAEVRAERATELATAKGYWERRALEQEIRLEVERRSGAPSPYALFGCR